MVAPVGLGLLPKTGMLPDGGRRQSTGMEKKADFLDFDKNSGVPGKKKLNNLLLLQKDDEQQVERKLKTEELVQTEAPEKSKPRIDRITPSPCTKGYLTAP